MFVIYESSVGFRIRNLKNEISHHNFRAILILCIFKNLTNDLIDLFESLVMLRDNASSFTSNFITSIHWNTFTFMNEERGSTDQKLIIMNIVIIIVFS